MLNGTAPGADGTSASRWRHDSNAAKTQGVKKPQQRQGGDFVSAKYYPILDILQAHAVPAARTFPLGEQVHFEKMV